ncbi:MAG: response regulator [Deltaproteobacteria bacterium]|nr:response regulator [Deltaproteobacteria bacterium]
MTVEATERDERRYRDLFDHMQEGFAYCRMKYVNGDAVDFTYLSVNKAFQKLTGLENVEGRPVSEVIPGIRASDPGLFEIYGRVATTGKPEKFETYVKGLGQWFSVSVYSPEPEHFVAVFDVVTDRKRSEETARRETSLRNVLLDNLPCVALVLRKKTREIVACNEMAKRYGAVVGRVCYDVLAVPGTPCPFCLAPEVWETSGSRQVEAGYMGKHWLGIWVPFSDDLYVHYIFEITDRKRAEEERSRLQSQLQQAMKMEAVGRLAGGVAHDFNNLLTVILGNLSLALGKVSSGDAVAEMLGEANRAAERAARLTQQLLAFSRKQIIEPKVLDPNGLVMNLHTMLSRLIGENIALVPLPGAGVGLVKVDPGQFEQILVNLAVNARDAMPDGGRLTIETSNAELDASYCARNPDVSPGRYVLVSVGDTGCGMTDEVKAKIFEPFFTTKEKGSGTGLGLSMTHGAVKQAGGSIAVTSEVGKGTTVRIYLPRVEGEKARVVEDPASEEFPGGTETVLLVEDEEMVRELGARVLERLGYKVLMASGGAEAVAVAREFSGGIDLLLTDVVMPGMNGSELASQLILLHPDMKVLFTSGYTENAIVHHGVLDEGVSFIWKPYTPSSLAWKIRGVLNGR